MDNFIFFFFYNLGQSYSWIATLSLFISYQLIYIVLACLLFWAIFFAKKKMYFFSIFVLTSFSAWLLARSIKFIFQIERPFLSLNINPLYAETGYSFPSEHMTVFSSLAIVVFFLNQKLGILLIFFAIIVGLTRLIIGVHYPSDILVGFILGYLIAQFYIKIFKNI